MKIRQCLLIALALLTPLSGLGCDRAFLFTTEQEIAMGDEAAPELEEQFDGALENARLQNYVAGIGQELTLYAERDMPYRFAVLRSETPNAFALPGGRIYITAGLMRNLRNERQLAAVLGHEIGHIVNKDSVKGIQNDLGVRILATIAEAALKGSGGQVAGTATKVAGSIVNLRYSRKQEYRADKCGITNIEKAGYNPWGGVEVLEVLQELKDSEGGSFLEIFQTHPLTSKRIEKARELVEEDYPSYPSDLPDRKARQFLEMR
ncbi:MAG: M48 family metalloprotease, partial [Planctomycetota bacterium]